MIDWFPGLGEKLGEGVDGSVYALANEDAVVKFSRSFDRELLAEIVAGYHAHYVKVLDFGVGESGIHFTVMERLLPITDDEAKVFHSLLSHEDKNAVKKRLTSAELDEVLAGLAKGLEFDALDVGVFYYQVMHSTIKHDDIHERNVMKNKDGEFKLIDLNRLSKEE
jgi:RIO-like serine/threonine protein kinase